MSLERYQWVAAPIFGQYEEGKRWRLEDAIGLEVGRVVQLLPGGLWEAHTTEGEWYSPGHESLQAAALALRARISSHPHSSEASP